jgi:hypothetical protein
MTPEQRAFKAIQERQNNDFLEKYEKVKPELDKRAEEGFKPRIEALKKADAQKTALDIVALKKQMRRIWGLPEETEEEGGLAVSDIGEMVEVPPKYVQVTNPEGKMGKILFDPEVLRKENPDRQETKYVQVDNAENGRRILFAPEAIKKQEDIAGVESLLKNANELATALKKEEQLLSYIEGEIEKVKDDLEKRAEVGYVDSVIDQYADPSRAAQELRDEYTFLIQKLKDLKSEKIKSEEKIAVVTQKLSE